MNKRALAYLGLASATLGMAFLYFSKLDQTSPTSHLDAQVVQGEAMSLPQATVQGGLLTGLPLQLQARKGQPVSFLLYTDADDELQVSGLDLTLQVPAQRTTKIDLSPSQTGVFNIELLRSRTLLGQLEVTPQ